ncbi:MULTISPECIES: Fur family transcriptional regulator [Lactobacillaceae]|uniref:Fur family transcriptional regulator n=1 Tax=Lactobacillaceae TaxID=33958 RepID=UPI0014573B4D|nr:Fur family transcriptional regulator [Lactobacillus sp. HBUAS51381]NLR08844.1 transcriptional repressor [Lactobacillus sp. HBUAS51381]
MADTLSAAVAILRKNKFKLTKQRHALLEFLWTNQGHYTDVVAVDAYMRTEFPGMSHNTVYRNLKEFEEVGIVEQNTEQERARVKYQCDFHHQHHHHFVCQNCGKVTELQMCPMDFFCDQLPGYEITGHSFELYGICAECKAAGVKAAPKSLVKN